MPNSGKRRRANKKRFTGSLAEPILVKQYRSTLVGLTQEKASEKNEEEKARAMKLLFAKLDDLFPHYGIEKTGNAADDYRLLALHLAQEFIPGFQLRDAGAPRRGRPSQDPLEYIRLLFDIEVAKRIIRQGHSTASNAKAARVLTTNLRFARRWGRYKGRERTLENMLIKARDETANPWYRLWRILGEAGRRKELQALVDALSITKKAG